ncbi:MAG TPA: T9SS type A sorting domain-containing protein [Chryseosolibacter sp.]
MQREGSAGRTKELPPLTLPFFDDFSDPYSDPDLKEVYPDTNRWENSLSVCVNSGLGINPPTINVATFDGLDSLGNAYNPTQIFVNGFTDKMVSRPIDISETAPTNPVSIAERNSVYLSFFYQWKGNGESPDPDDYLQVQFRNASNAWETVTTINTTPSLEKDKFYQVLVKVDGDRFFTNRFQFRFRAFGRQSGPYDTWNLDYIYLNKSRSATDIGLPDGAISSPLTTIFPNQYRAMPYYHFLAAPNVIAPTFLVSNRRGDPPDVLNYYVEGIFTNYFYSATDTTTTTIAPAPPASIGINNEAGGTIFPFETRTVTVKQINTIDTVTTLDPNADAAVIELKAHLVTGDVINPETGGPADDYEPKFAPIDFRVNDTIRARYELKDYYAYDDGVAEYAGGLIAAGNVFAYQFDLPDNLNDTVKVLEAFDIYFPPFGLTTSQNVDFFVFDEDNGKPNEILVRISSVAIRNQGTNTFQRVRFLPALQITQNKFFVGWRQPVSGQVLVGIDNSNDTGNKMFFNTEGSINPDPARWEANTLIKGSFMVRPVFGTGIVDPTTGLEEDTRLAVYPNPNSGSFLIAGKPENISVLSLTGQPVRFDSEAFDDRTYIRLNVPSGLYLVRYRSNGVVHTQKIVVTQ